MPPIYDNMACWACSDSGRRMRSERLTPIEHAETPSTRRSSDNSRSRIRTPSQYFDQHQVDVSILYLT